MLPASPKARLIAFYLPQFHPIPENDEWWGKGFTEWSNVARARPLFRGHYQPHLPADLGFYDLRLPETRQAQADLAREYGIHGFCYYHYWFNGKRLLERPFAEVLASGKPDFPFCLCWANENWTRRWDGHDEEVLVAQEYCEEDDKEHIRWLIDAFRDKRYITVKGKPLYLVYRSHGIPDPLRTTSIWREEAQRMGIGELFLCAVASCAEDQGDPTGRGFDAAVEFQPDWLNLGLPLRRGTHDVHDYSLIIERMLRKRSPPYRRFPCVTPSWDNAARRQVGAVILKGSTPALYQQWLTAVLRASKPGNPDENLVFINAWNEWGEGNHLEPCQRWGRGYLEATRRAIDNADEPALPVPERLEERSPEEGVMACEFLTRAVLDDVVASVHRLQAELVTTADELEAATAELQYLGRLRLAIQDILTQIPAEEPFILVDDDQFVKAVAAGGRAIPFLERNGQYWGAPADDETAIRELQRLRQAGASFIVFGWPAFWWLEYYSEFSGYLRTKFPCPLENERLVVFDLRQGS
jgi:hypothetical protein